MEPTRTMQASMVVIDLHADGCPTTITVAPTAQLDGAAVTALADLVDELRSAGTRVGFSCDRELRQRIDADARCRRSDRATG